MAVLLWLLVPLATSCGGGTSVAAENVRVLGKIGRNPGDFSKPRAVAVSGDNLIVADRTGRIQRFELSSGRFLNKWMMPAWSNGTPTGVTIDPIDGSVWIADTHYQKIRHYDLDGNQLFEFGKEGTNPGEMIFPTDVCPDPNGETIWICEYGLRSRIMQFTRKGEFVSEWGSGEYEYKELLRPMAIRFDAQEHLIVVDGGNHRILTYDRSGKLLDSWGEPGAGPGQLKYPYDVSIDGDGNLVIVEYGNSRVSRFTPNGKFLGSWGSPGYGPGQLFSPWGVAVSPTGDLVVADTGNGRIQVVPHIDKIFRGAV